MTTEEKAKAYDEVREIIALKFGSNVAEEIFSKFEETENEKIRKALINVFATHKDYEMFFGVSVKDINAWLERQGSQDNAEDVDILHRFSFYSYKDEPNVLYLSGLYVNEECRNKGIGTKILEVADEVAKSLNCHAIRLKTKKDSNAERLYRTHGYNSLTTEERDWIWLEKQGHTDNIIEKAKTEKQRVIITETDGNANIDWNTRSLEDARKLLECGLQYINKELEKQSKPKFKIGDWIINHQTGLIKHIKNVLLCGINGVYEFESSSMPIDYVDNSFHLWSVKDAKDGDVLYFSDETIVIFKDLYNATTFHSYCHIEDGIFNISKDDMPDWWEAEGFKPATKEQCGVLFQKMKESGYEWNNEKKELLEIEEELTDFEKSLKHIMIETLECGDTRNLKADAEMLLRLAQEPKEWSEEDEEHLNSIISDIKTDMGAYPRSQEVIDIYNDDISFLKSLRDRVQPQPKQEWCEEDEKKIDRAIWLIDHYATHGHDKKLREDVISGLESLKRK